MGSDDEQIPAFSIHFFFQLQLEFAREIGDMKLANGSCNCLEQTMMNGETKSQCELELENGGHVAMSQLALRLNLAAHGS